VNRQPGGGCVMDTRPPKPNSTRRRKNRFPCTDAGNAELLSAACRDLLRYDHGRGCWLIWQEHWWAPDESQLVLQIAKKAARLRLSQARQISDEEIRRHTLKWARLSESKQRIEAALALARSERPLSTTADRWDSDPWLLGVGNGVIDLRTGKIRNGKPGDLISMHTPVSFDPAAACPRFEQFMEEVFGGDKELIEYVQRSAGYCLTGDVSEQVMFIPYGMGANGKTTFLVVLCHVLGNYACNLPFSAFELKARSTIPNEIAELPGKRYVTAAETNESAELNEARIKALTGCDPMSARKLYRNLFTFTPTGKFWLAVNHLPQVADDSHGFWRRVRLIPFNQQFGPDRADRELLAKLKAEAPGILAWLVRGCLAWQQLGLKPPPTVELATQEYREENDVLGEFLDDRCVGCPNGMVCAGALWEAFCYWSADNGSTGPLLDRKAFSARLKAKGFKKDRRGHGRTRIWVGLRLRTTADDVSSTPQG
jgi:putative DNA primase/helicase